jgi:hypothetical protein
MEQQEDDAWGERAAWIREQLGNPEADEDDPSWDRLSREYEAVQQGFARDFFDDDWEVPGKTRIQIFWEHVSAAGELLTLDATPSTKRSLLVMLHAHIVAAVEAYLSTTFIECALASDELLRKLVETDPEFAKRKFTIQEIFSKQDTLKEDVRIYLKNLIFHDIAKTKNMYSSVLNTDFGEVKWLFEAVVLRHDCVHRAGYNKEGEVVSVSEGSILTLLQQCSVLVTQVEESIAKLPAAQSKFF